MDVGLASDKMGECIADNVNLHFTFTFMHLADAFIQSDLHCIQVTVLHLSALALPGNRTHDLSVANAMLYQLSYRKVYRYFYRYFMNYYDQTESQSSLTLCLLYKMSY